MSNPKQPLVSVIMPVYNCEPYIDEALDSVINQTYKNLEIIIVDDGSNDKTWEIVQRYAKRDTRIKPFHNKSNSRVVVTLNTAIRHSHGQYLARMDGDDIRDLTGIEKQVEYLQSHPGVVVVGTAAEICDQNMNRKNDRFYQTEDSAIRKKIFRHSPFCGASIVMRANALEKDPYHVYGAEDYDLHFRLGNAGKMANLGEVLYKVRTYKTSFSQSATRLNEKTTLKIRITAVRRYGYKMSSTDKIYFLLQASTMYLMPPRSRFWLFNKIRARSK